MFTLPPLPYDDSALSPHVSAETLQTHHGKHHQKYVDTLNKLVAGTQFENAELEEVIKATSGSNDKSEKKIFNNAAQHWNHSFLWESMTPDYNLDEQLPVIAQIDRDFGDFQTFRAAFMEEGVGHFGSGWVWLVVGESGLEIISTHDADLPLAHGKHALLTCDVWEHAYYLDHKSDRQGYLEKFVDRLANWQFASANLERNSSALQTA